MSNEEVCKIHGYVKAIDIGVRRFDCQECVGNEARDHFEDQLHKIAELSRNDSMVAHIFNLYRNNQLDWSQALFMMVKHLSEKNKHVMSMIDRHVQICGRPWDVRTVMPEGLE